MTFDRPVQISSRKEFMDFLGGIMSAEPSEEEEGDEEAERRGRPRELKSYLFESNTKIPPEFKSETFSWSVKDTGVDNIKILNLTSGGSVAGFYLDLSDERFWVLHTGNLATDAHKLVRQLAYSPLHQFDRAWIPSQLLITISNLPGNTFDGFGLEYEDLFTPSEVPDVPITELTMTVSGASSRKALNAVTREEDLQRSISYNKISVKRGTRSSFSKDDLVYNGTFSVRSGTSIDDHISLVDETRVRYKEKVQEIEQLRLGTREVDGVGRIEGKAFNFTFDRKIEDFSLFLHCLFNSKAPFRLWGLKVKIADDYYQVLALDMHTGQPIDFEISSNLIRVYLPEETCGNSLLRLYVNLQHYFDSTIHCEELFP